MTRAIVELYIRAIKGKRWLEKHEGSNNYEAGLTKYEMIVDELAESGLPAYPSVITRDPKDRFGYPNKEYLKNLPLQDHNEYVKFKFEELSILIDEGFFKIDPKLPSWQWCQVWYITTMMTQHEIEKEIERCQLYMNYFHIVKKDEKLAAYQAGQIKVLEKFLGEKCPICGERYLSDDEVAAIQDDKACTACQLKHDR